MIELNLRIVQPGATLTIAVRRAHITGSSSAAEAPDLMELVCSHLQSRRGLAAIPASRAGFVGDSSVLIATTRTLPTVHLAGDDWELDVVDAGSALETLSFANPAHHVALAELVQRALLIQVARGTDLWRINGRPRTWYDRKPFRCAEGIAAYRRYTMSCIAIPEVGIGVAVDVGTGFFTSDSLAYFFDPHVPQAEQTRRQRRFERLVERQRGRKGTLLYDNSRTHSIAYFEKPPNGVTCATTGPIRLNGESYVSLLEYYRAKYPKLTVAPNAPVVKVSFPGRGRPVWVAADRVHASVMNDNVPQALKQIDKIAPAERKRLIEGIWHQLGPRPFGFLALDVVDEFWRPEERLVVRIAPPALLYGRSGIVKAPLSTDIAAYHAYFRRRQLMLDQSGCYAIPTVERRQIHCVYPSSASEEAVRQLVEDTVAALRRWTNQDWRVTPVPYVTFMTAVEELRQVDRGVALLVLDGEPATYFEAAYQLQGWRLKRVTKHKLSEKHRDRGGHSGNGMKRWQQYVQLTALDLLQQMDAVLWRTLHPNHYEAQLAIDVGYDSRHYALSLLHMRDMCGKPDHATASDFRIVTRALSKADPRQETINHVILADEIWQTVRECLVPDERAVDDPIRSLLILRDGRVVGREREGIEAAVKRLRDDGLLANDACVDVVEIRKDSLKSLRMWEIEATGEVTNALEGTAVRLCDTMALLTTTGRATLHQGTAEPLLLTGEGNSESLLRAAGDVFAGAQLNWASPAMAQRLPLALKRTDSELKARAAQEVRRLR